MKAFKGKIIIGSACALLSVSASVLAQESPGPWYLGVNAGAAFQQNLTFKNSSGETRSFDTGVRLDLSGGTRLSDSWRVELDLGFIYNPVNSEGSRDPESDSGYFQAPIMANAIYSVTLRGPFSLDIGAGLGGVWTALWDGLDAEAGMSFGYQAIAQVKYAPKENLGLGISYKLLGTTDHDLGPDKAEGTLSHAVLATFTFRF